MTEVMPILAASAAPHTGSLPSPDVNTSTTSTDNYNTTTQPTATSQPNSLVAASTPFRTAPMAIAQEEEEPLFSPSLISPEVLAILPEGYTARPLRRSDYQLGYLDVLRVLTTVGDISYEQWNERYNFMAKRNDEYYLMVICDEAARIVATGSLIVERKFIHALGQVGHIEDIAVSTDQQGKKLGLRVIQTLDSVAAKVGCYKSILDCSEANEGFYLKCGFRRAGLEMAHYY